MNRRFALARLGALASVAVGTAQMAGCAPVRRARDRDAMPLPSLVAPPDPPQALVAALRQAGSSAPALLALGEIHDNAVQHSLRLRWLELLLERGGRFGVAMEQLDAAHQDRIDALRAADARAGTPTDARALAQAGGFSFDGWDWRFYEPVIAWALRRGLPLIGANLANAQTASIARGQPHALAQAQPAGWRDADESRQQREIAEAHCGVLPASVLPAMARAQRARDATMAQALQRARVAHRMPVVLLAGNGHVRRDLGVPRYLADSGPAGAMLTVGFVERPVAGVDARAAGGPSPGPAQSPLPNSSPDSPAGAAASTRDAPPSLDDDPAGLYDWRVLTAPQPRPDPCAGLRERMGSGGRALIDRSRPVGQ